MRSALIVLLLAGCCQPIPAPITIPAPAEWAMQACEPWPQIDGDGRVSLPDAEQAVIDAKVAHAACDARHESLRGYVADVVKPGE